MRINEHHAFFRPEAGEDVEPYLQILGGCKYLNYICKNLCLREMNISSKPYKFKILPFFLICLLTVIPIIAGSCQHRKEKAQDNILLLDSLLVHSEEFLLRQLTKIAELKQNRRNAKTDAEAYLYDNLLFENYFIINADSALIYADASIKSALKTGNNEWVTQSLIGKSSLLAATGLLKEALEVMESVDKENLSESQLVDYYGQMIFLYSHLGNFAEGFQNDYYVTERIYKDSVMRVITPSHPEYLWYKGWDILGSNRNPDSLINALENYLANSELSDRQDAKHAYILARLYEQKGEREKYLSAMALSAIIDVKIANAEISSLEDLATVMFDNGNGDVDRAYSYIEYSLNKALNYPNRTKALGIAKTLDNINEEYQKRIDRQRHRTTVFLILVCVLAGILLVAIVAIILQNKKLNRQRKNVDEANDSLNQKVEQLSKTEGKLSEVNALLKELNADLKDKNEQLYESNFIKEEYIGYVFNLCSSYIAKIEDLKRNIHLKALKKQYKEIEVETADIDMKEELKDFYHSFDTIFLTLYPNFVSDFNSLLKPDKQINLKEGELLNMELRIYALIRLGISDSVKIADFLHCAHQTVYNYRLRARSRALYPKKDFIEMVKSLGNFLGKEDHSSRNQGR